MTTPATRMSSFLASPCAGERARIVGLVAVLALELDEPADRQPVERVERLAAVAAAPCARGGKPIAELEHPDIRQPGRDEVAELVDEDQHAEDQDEQDDRDERLGEAGHAPSP